MFMLNKISESESESESLFVFLIYFFLNKILLCEIIQR